MIIAQPQQQARLYPEAWIQTYTGRQFFPLEPHHGDVSMEDIAHALSMICRYGGHSNRFYSVAEHSVLVASKAGLHGLLHDAAEAYVGDMVRPIKVIGEMWFYRVAEERILAAIYDAFGLTHPTIEETRAVKEADNRTLATEKLSLHHDGHPWNLPEPYDDMAIAGWMPDRAEQEFMRLWEELRTAAGH